MEEQVSAHVVVGDPGMSGHGHITVLGLAWDRNDPLAIHLTLAAQPDHPSLPRGEWDVLRDFLRYGIEEPTGDGAVRIRPASAGVVLLELHGEQRTYSVHAPAQVLAEFLDETEAIVPTGTEAGDDVLDALIARLMDQ